MDAAVAGYLAVLLLAVAQMALLDVGAGTLARGALPFAVGLVVAVAVRVFGPGPQDVEVARVARVLVAAAGTALAMWALGAFVGALPFGIGQPSGFYRVKGLVTTPVGDHNTAAGILLVGLVATASVAGDHPRWRAAFVATTLGFVATLSRGALVVLAVVTVGAWWWAHDRGLWRRLAAATVAATVLVLGAAVVLDASPPDGAEVPDGPLGASVTARIDLAQRGVEVGLAQPALGVGLGQFAAVAGDLPEPNDHAHQLFANAFAEGGLLLVAVAAALPLVLLLRVRRMPASPLRDLVALGGLGLVLHAQMEILGGRLGYEATLGLLLGLAAAQAMPVARGAGVTGRTGRGR